MDVPPESPVGTTQFLALKNPGTAACRSGTDYSIWMGMKDREGVAMKDEASYNCDSCGEEIVVPIDGTAGSRQEYVEDCPVCCCPNVIHVEIDEDGDVRVWAERE
jgi:hypothetical protein